MSAIVLRPKSVVEASCRDECKSRKKIKYVFYNRVRNRNCKVLMGSGKLSVEA